MPMGAKGSTRHLMSSGDTCCVRRAGGTSHSPSRAKAALALTHVLILTVPTAPSHLVECDGCNKSYESTGMMAFCRWWLGKQERRQTEHGESGA
ncbi:hypothetical protein CI102_14225 [Trichoderma harzianum]|nr:hypothetical protein CI102_14225 [Trichoderma harzianum]